MPFSRFFHVTYRYLHYKIHLHYKLPGSSKFFFYFFLLQLGNCAHVYTCPDNIFNISKYCQFVLPTAEKVMILLKKKYGGHIGKILHILISGKKSIEDNPIRPGFKMTSSNLVNVRKLHIAKNFCSLAEIIF